MRLRPSRDAVAVTVALRRYPQPIHAPAHVTALTVPRQTKCRVLDLVAPAIPAAIGFSSGKNRALS